MRLAPGNPFDSEKPIDPQVKEKLMQKYHLDKPFYIQAYHYITNVLKGDFGPSLKRKDLSVNQYIKLVMPKSFTIGIITLILSLMLVILFGTIAAIKKNTRIDYVIRVIAIFGISVPTFVTGPIFAIFSIRKIRTILHLWLDYRARRSCKFSYAHINTYFTIYSYFYKNT